MEDPQVTLKPRAIISMVTGHDAFFVLDSPNEIRDKRAALANDAELGGNEDPGEHGLIVLAGVDIYSDGAIEPYDLSLNPSFILHVKEVTDRGWKAHLDNAGLNPETGKPLMPPGEPVEPDAEGVPPFIQTLMKAGVQVNMVGGGRFGVGEASSRGTIDAATVESAHPLLTEDAKGDEKCCCGHQAEEHYKGEKVIESCNACPCGMFHTHTEDTEHGDEEQLTS